MFKSVYILPRCEKILASDVMKTTLVCMHNTRCLHDTKIKTDREEGGGGLSGGADQ